MSNKRDYKLNIIVYILVISVLLISLCFSTYLTRVFRLRPANIPGHDVTSVHIVDVGQGSCALIHFASGEDMMIDSGVGTASKKLISYINNVFFLHGDNKFEHVILTHSDSDHSGNMEYIINNYKIDNFYRPNIISTLAGETEDSDSYIDSVNQVYAGTIRALNSKSNIRVITCAAGVTITNSNSTLLTMYTPDRLYSDVNDFSPVMILGDSSISVCITGDASKSVEEYAVNNNTLPKVDLLVLGHHGSKTSTSYQLLKAIQPDRVAISVGKNNYGHPSSETYDTLMQYDSEYGKSTYNTKMLTLDQGNIIYYSTGSGYSITTISNVDDYLHMDYWLVVLIACAGSLTVFVYPMSSKRSRKVAKGRKQTSKR